MFYSELTGGFYVTAIHGSEMPFDVVEIAAEEHAALLDAQSSGKIIQAGESGKPEAIDRPPPPFADLADAKKSQINNWRDAACNADVSVTLSGTAHQFQSDQRSQSLISGAVLGVMAGISPPPSVWRSADNVNVAITLDDLKAIGLAMVTQTNAAYLHSWELKALVDAATTQPELDAINW